MRYRSILPLFALSVIFVTQPAVAQQKTPPPPEFISWLPISSFEKEQAKPTVDKDAGAEILLWRVHVVDEYTGEDLQRALYHYIRIKIFDEKGKAAVTTVDLPYHSPGNILDLAGRTIKADGTITELDSKTVFRRDLVRNGGRKEKVVSFALPAVEVGAIVEYRWRQTQDDNRFRYLRLNFARELPVKQVTYFVRPLSSAYVASDLMFLAPFNCTPTPMKRTNDGWNETTLENVAASTYEPYAPSTPNLEPWALLYYRAGGNNDPKKYWADYGRKTYNEMKASLKASDDLKAVAAKIAAESKSDDEKLVAMIAYVRHTLRGLFDASVTDAERAEFIKKLPNRGTRTSADIFKSGIALSNEMNIAFAALAIQGGFDARPALIADRNELHFEPEGFAESYFLDSVAMAVKQGDGWKVVDVSNRHLTPGMLPWNEEGESALITDSKTPVFIKTPPSLPPASSELRTAGLQLGVDGSLKGDVKESYTGHRADAYRDTLGTMSPAQQEEWLHNRVISMFPGADVQGIKLLNIDDSTKTLQMEYHMEAPSFAQVTGKRILFQPNAFRRADGVPFTASVRRFPVQIPYGWKESDQLRITLPEGFTLENAENPGNLEFGEPGGYKLAIAVSTARDLVVTRELVFGDKGLVNFQQTAYPALKQIFEVVHQRDTISLSLKGN